ncbi:histone deacetylase family protein [Marinobacterium rhizophilum]|uniref:Histone deacetylase family protein n=1 Tax=Marinobacterium rhizophilum TaxID=420402 RepID=A0ABY5HKI5_9GAMM|nr:histone deacetylase family protein [Marinobacterium rhizophilum]UTW12900.1 histone deacetylase family protein [Marinobacterium rhizophilum]
MTTAYISHNDCALHDMGASHPESPQRLQAISARLSDSGLLQRLDCLTPAPIQREQLALAHPEPYIRELEALQPRRGHSYADPDTALNPHSLHAARLAAGAVLLGTERILGGSCQNAFCAVRPPGHHAEQVSAMGFCLFNNVALGVEWALQHSDIERVAVLDFDVHHGNGTVDIFKDRPEVLVCSSFQYPFYPFRYQDIQRSHIVHTPLPAGTVSSAFRQAIERDWLPALARHRPDMIFISAGFDAHRADPLGQLQLEDEDFHWITGLIGEAANRYAGARLLSVLEGGYDLPALGRCAEAHVKALLEAR